MHSGKNVSLFSAMHSSAGQHSGNRIGLLDIHDLVFHRSILLSVSSVVDTFVNESSHRYYPPVACGAVG